MASWDPPLDPPLHYGKKPLDQHVHDSNKIVAFRCEGTRWTELLHACVYRLAILTFGEVCLTVSPCPSFPESPDPNDQTVRPSELRARVCATPQETSFTLDTPVTLVGVFRLVVLPWPGVEAEKMSAQRHFLKVDFYSTCTYVLCTYNRIVLALELDRPHARQALTYNCDFVFCVPSTVCIYSNYNVHYLCTHRSTTQPTLTQSAVVSLPPCVQLPIHSHCCTVPVTTRHKRHNLQIQVDDTCVLCMYKTHLKSIFIAKRLLSMYVNKKRHYLSLKEGYQLWDLLSGCITMTKLAVVT